MEKDNENVFMSSTSQIRVGMFVQLCYLIGLQSVQNSEQ
jgi:hypothetical protein